MDGTRTSDRVDGLDNSLAYAFVIASIDHAQNTGIFSDPICATPAPVDDFYDLFVSADGESGFCFVATVAYGDVDHPDVRTLRWFRDNVLIRLPGGSWLIGQYYAVGPGLARNLQSSPVGLWLVREGLEVTSAGLRVGRAAGPALPLMLVLAMLGVGLSRRWRRS